MSRRLALLLLLGAASHALPALVPEQTLHHKGETPANLYCNMDYDKEQLDCSCLFYQTKEDCDHVRSRKTSAKHTSIRTCWRQQQT